MNKNNDGPVRYPPPYRVKDGCLWQEVVTKQAKYDRKLCNFLPYLTAEITLDDGAEETKRLRLGGVRENGTPLPEIEIAGSELASFNWLLEKWGVDCILEIGSTVKDSIRYAIQQTASGAERKTVYAVTGWKKIDGAWRYLLPGDDVYDVQLPGKLKRYGKEEGADTVDLAVVSRLTDMLVAPKEIVYPLLAYTFLTPLNEFLRRANCEPKFVFFLQGRTGTRKSTLAALFLSFFGSFTASELPLSFRDPANSITHHSFALKDVLTCIDDFHPSSRQEEVKLTATAQAIMRTYGDRTGRGRLRADATPMESRPPQGNAIITAELPPDIGESGTARYFSVELKDGDVDLHMLSLFQQEAAKGVFRRCLSAYTDWIRDRFLSSTEEEQEFISALQQHFTEYRDEFSGSGVRCHGRVPEMVAWLQLGWKLFLLFLQEQEMFTGKTVSLLENEFQTILFEIAARQAQHIERDKPTHIFIRKLYALLESGQAKVLQKDNGESFEPTGFVGYEDETFLYLNREIAHRMVKRLCDEQGEAFPISARALTKALAEEELIDVSGGMNTRAIRFGDKTRRMICLRKDKAELIVNSTYA